ncbi:hypothetical protein JW752_03535 [Candidatus Peregrinibacteria bacterium]|nr:hypothetical protein [Candidatus Peregrinibacteria bacterium]
MTNEEILTIISEGEDAARKLLNSDLKDRILGHFKTMKDRLENEEDCGELEMLAKELTIGVKEALSFKDMDILAEVEANVWNDISNLER